MRDFLKRGLTVGALALTTILGVTGCADDAGNQTQDATEVRDLYRNFRDLDLNDLLSLGAGFATDELNDQLAFSDYGSIRLEPTEIYTLADEAQGDVTLQRLDQLSSGLVDRFGYRELTTQVNMERRQHLEASNDIGYAESSFTIRGQHHWSQEVPGFDEANVRLGFNLGAELEARVITAVDSEPSAYLDAPLAATKAARGFVLPTSVEDVRDMTPGESFALRGQGQIGFNAGVGVPILITTVEALTYNLVLSAGLRTLSRGTVDVQLVRMADNSVVVDVGIEDADIREAKVALNDGWGVQGLLEAQVELGAVSVDLGRMVEKAIQKQLDKKLDLIDARFQKTQVKHRLSVGRFRFDLNGDDSARDTALAQALKGDLRLAQALANTGEERGVEAMFELSRSGVSATSYAGIDILGMRFFNKVIQGAGEVTVQTPGGARTILFDSLHEEGGIFFSSHGFTRVGLAGMVFDAEHPEGHRAETNLLLQVLESDKAMENDKLLDHVDGLILSVGGDLAYQTAEIYGSAIERRTQVLCPDPELYDDCLVDVLDDAEVVALRAEGDQQMALAVADLPQNLQELVRAAGRMRFMAQATVEIPAGLTGPPSSVVLDYRLDDTALRSLLQDNDRATFEQALGRVVIATHIDRDLDPTEVLGERDEILDDEGKYIAQAGEVFADAQRRWVAAIEAESMTLRNHPELGEMGPRAIEIRFEIDQNNAPKYGKVVARSLAQARSRVATQMFDDLEDKLDRWGLDEYGENLVAYTLLALTPRESLDVRFDYDVDPSDSLLVGEMPQYRKAGYVDVDLWAQGPNVSRIDGGLFDVDALIDID